MTRLLCRFGHHRWRELHRQTWKPQDDGTEGTATDRCERCSKKRRRFLVAA